MRSLRWMLVVSLSVTACFDEPRPAIDASPEISALDAVTPADDTVAPADDAITLPDVSPLADLPAVADVSPLADLPVVADVGAPADVAPGACARDEQCTDPLAPQCDVARGRCVACLAAADRCPPSQHCDAETSLCVPGCRSDEGCESDGGARRCDTARHTCVECSDDGQCPANTLCSLGACVPGCSNARGCPSGQTCCDGTCHDITQDPAHCAMCGRGCSYRNAAPRCDFGTCAMGACNEPYANCDGATTNGCEVNTRTDPAHCGACNSRCEVAINATAATCVAGRCAFTCADNFADCDGDPRNGCETDLRTDVRACGRCGALCASAPNAPTITCAAGRCGYTCAAGRGRLRRRARQRLREHQHLATAPAAAPAAACRSGRRSQRDGGCTAGRCTLQCDGGVRRLRRRPRQRLRDRARQATSRHCGACGRTLRVPGGTTRASVGACVVTVAAAPRASATATTVDGNGCEADLTRRRSPTAAPAATAVPRAQRTGRRPARRRLRHRECVAGFGDCDGNAGQRLRDRTSHQRGPLRRVRARLRARPTACTASCAAGACAYACARASPTATATRPTAARSTSRTSAANCGACGRRGVELCDGVDNDCDGVADEACPAGLTNLDTVTHTSGTFGSRTGTAFDLNCPAGTVARGMSGRVGSYLTQIALQCATPRVVEDREGNPFRYTVALDPAAGVGPAGVATGTAWSFTCPGDSVIGRIDGRLSGSVIYQVSFDCFDLSVAGAPSSGFTINRAAAVSSSPTFGPNSGTAFTPPWPHELPPARELGEARGLTPRRVIVHALGALARRVRRQPLRRRRGPTSPASRTSAGRSASTRLDVVFLTEHEDRMARWSFERCSRCGPATSPSWRTGARGLVHRVPRRAPHDAPAGRRERAHAHRAAPPPGPRRRQPRPGLPRLRPGGGAALPRGGRAGRHRPRRAAALAEAARALARPRRDLQRPREHRPAHRGHRTSGLRPRAPRWSDILRFRNASRARARPRVPLHLRGERQRPAKWARCSPRALAVPGFAASDAHENAIPAPLSDGERGDSYRRVFRLVLQRAAGAGELTRASAMEAIQRGRVVRGVRGLRDPVGFSFTRPQTGDRTREIGERDHALVEAHGAARSPGARRCTSSTRSSRAPTTRLRILRAERRRHAGPRWPSPTRAT
jgi:hypothetical protein